MRSVFRIAPLALAALVLAVPSGASPSGEANTIAGRLDSLDRYVETENAAGLDAPRLDGRNWYDHDILFAAVVAEGSLVSAVTAPETAVTLLAPNDRAFQLLARDLTGKWLRTEQEVLDAIVSLVEAGDVDLGNVLAHHVVPGRVVRSALPFGEGVATLNSADSIVFRPRFFGLLVEVRDNVDSLRNPYVLRADLDAGASVVHAISRVLIPVNVGG